MRLALKLASLVALAATLLPMAASAQIAAPPAVAPKTGDYVIKDFRFESGETLPALRIHYTTLGEPQRDAHGHVSNAVLLLHGTGGSGSGFQHGEFADILLKPGGLLDPAKYFIIMPDGIGHGGSSKPSDGLRMRFPKYDYDDMVAAQHVVVADALHIDNLRLILGVSMGCMQAFVWAETWPGYARALMPLACNARRIAGRNRLIRDMEILLVKSDPAWKGGDYETEPVAGLMGLSAAKILGGSAVLRMQKELSTPDLADARAASSLARLARSADANDEIYQTDSSRDYDPHPRLETITVPVMWVNSADDFLNPPELGFAQQDVRKLRRGRFVLIPGSEKTNGHATHSMPSIWESYLAELLTISR
jgi:homoserine O-acetyltransferase/O-succinyltransferase